MLQPPPRRVPARLWLRLAFGGTAAQLAWYGIAITTIISTSMRDEHHARQPSLALIFLALWTPLLVYAGFGARRHLALLRNGVATDAKLFSKRVSDDGESSEWTYTFAYEVDGVQHTTAVFSREREKLLEDDVREPLVYDPRDPKRATPVDHLPGAPRVIEGKLVAREEVGVVAVTLIGPAFAVLMQIAAYTG